MRHEPPGLLDWSRPISPGSSPPRTSAMSVWATGGRLTASLLDTSTDTRADAEAPRPSDTVYANATVPTAPGAGMTCTAP